MNAAMINRGEWISSEYQKVQTRAMAMQPMNR